MTSGITMSNQGIGENIQLSKINNQLPQDMDGEQKNKLKENFADNNDKALAKTAAGVGFMLPSAALYGAVAFSDKLRENKRDKVTAESFDQPVSRRKFLRSATEIAANGAGLVAASYAIQSGGGYVQARNARQTLSSMSTNEHNTNLLETCKSDEKRNYAGIFEGLLVAGGAAVIGHAEILARKQEEAEEKSKTVSPVRI